MRYEEYGNDGAGTVVLLHGGGLGPWSCRRAALLLADRFRVILPVLDGHAGSGRPFTTIRANAEEILSFLDERSGGRADLIGGLSLGGQVLLEMLALRRDVCRFAIVESASVIPDRLTAALVGAAIGMSYGLIANRAFAKLQFSSLRLPQELFEDYFRDTRAIGKGDLAAFTKASAEYCPDGAAAGTAARVRVFAGGKEVRRILRSADVLRDTIPGCERTILPGLYHGGFSICRPEEYARTAMEMLAEGSARCCG